MKRFLLFSIHFLFVIGFLNSQNLYTKIIVDQKTRMPIQGVHVYKSDQYKTGTISNESGRFVLKNLSNKDTIIISHLSYMPISLSLNEKISDTIMLIERTLELEEVTVYPEKAYTILKNVIDSLHLNHSIEPVMYEVFVRSTKFEEDYSELHVLSEYVLKLFQNKKSNSEFQVVKVRAKPFSKAGKKFFKDMRIMSAISIQSENIFKYKEDIFRIKKLKKFDIEVIDEISNESNSFVKLNCTPKKEREDYNNIVLYIDKTTYGIQKMIKYYSSSGDEFHEIGFKQINGSWYLGYSKRVIKTELFHKWKSESKAISMREVIYNIDNSTIYNQNFKTAFDLVAEPIKWYKGGWTESFWDNYNYIPLPDWINKEIIE